MMIIMNNQFKMKLYNNKRFIVNFQKINLKEFLYTNKFKLNTKTLLNQF